MTDIFSNDQVDDTPEMEAPVTSYTLTDDQQAGLEFLIDFCMKRTTYQRVTLEGYAGTGKTFLINRVVEAVKRLRPTLAFGMTAPTHKAVRNLQKHSEMKDSLSFGTIHSFLGLKQVLKKHPKKAGEMIETFERDKEQRGVLKIDSIHVLIVDESSMLSDELYEHIDEAVRSRQLVVIYTGDGLQIPPVGKKQETGTADAIPFVPVQQKSRQIHLLRLNEIVRQGKDNPIIGYATAIREQVKLQSTTHPLSHSEDAGVEVLPRSLPQLRELFERYFCTEAFQDDPDYVKVIAWRNSTVEYFNREIRLLINKVDTLPRIINGDKLILDKPYAASSKLLLPNNEEMTVNNHKVVSFDYAYQIIDRGNAFDATRADSITSKVAKVANFKVYLCNVTDSLGRRHEIRILHEDDEQNYTNLRENLVAAAKKAEFFESKDMWKEFFKVEKFFAWTKHNYCLTAHKAQGSTYDYCFSMEWDINENRDIEERNRIKYVAATRARNKLFLIR